MRIISIIWAVLMVAAILYPIGYSLHLMEGWVGFIYGGGIGGLGVILGNIWYNSIINEEAK